MFAALGGTGAVGAAGFIPLKSGGRVWDKYLSGLRAIETASPAAILRTFRLSEFFSPLETWDNISMSKPELASAGAYREYLQRTLGITEDISMQRMGTSAFGEIYSGGKLAGYGFQMQAGTQQGAAIADYFARVQGMDLGTYQGLGKDILRGKYADAAAELGMPLSEYISNLPAEARDIRIALGVKLREEAIVFGQKIMLSGAQQRQVAKAELMLTLARARMATTAGRLNVLLSKPLDVPIIGSALSKIPGIGSMAVKPGTATEIFGRMLKKGLILGAAYKGAEYYDYLRASGSPFALPAGIVGGAAVGGLAFKGVNRYSMTSMIAGAAIGAAVGVMPRFDSGLFYGLASVPADLNIKRAELSESIGLSESLRRQEEVTPGLISPATAIGFGGVGALIGGFGSYAPFLAKGIKQKIVSGGVTANIFEDMRTATRGRLAKMWTDTAVGKKLTSIPGAGKYLGKLTHPMSLGFAAGLAAWVGVSSGLSVLSGNLLASIPGLNLLGSTETPEDLRAVYSGQKDVPVRKGRAWEMGRSSSWFGGQIEYYRPHMLARLKSRAYEKGLYGSDESERWDYDPLLHPISALFGSDEWKYHYEMEHAGDRPSPLSSTYGENIPFIGPIIAATVGKALKPRKLIRPEEWDLGDGEFAYRPDIRGENEPAYELGGLLPGAPVAPEEGSQLFNEEIYRHREAVGLPGYVSSVIQKELTGREEILPNLQTIEPMGRETSAENWLFKHLNLGGAITASEPVRRYIPRTPSYWETYNPLKNTGMPSWMPKDYYLDFFYGNVFGGKLPEAEIRLAGPGYSALNPEVEGVAPENYPLINRLDILADVASWSREYRNTLQEAVRQKPSMSSEDLQRLATIQEQVAAKKVRREFQDYRFGQDNLISSQATITDVLGPDMIRAAEFGNMNIQLQGIGKVSDEAGAAQFMQGLVGKQVTLQMPKLESNRYDLTAAGGRMKAVAMLGDTDIGTALEGAGLGTAGPLEDEFAGLRFGANEQLAGSAWEFLAHNAETPLEYMTPMSPAAKLIRQRSPIESYIKEEAVGTGAAFWDRPVSNFLAPAEEMFESKFGDSSPSPEVEERRSVQEYWDMLKWVKEVKLENQAAAEGDLAGTLEHRRIRESHTVFGVNPFGSPVSIMTALPRRERDFFEEFSNTQDDESRRQIMELIPENERRIYAGQWMRQQQEAIRAKTLAGIATDQDAEEMASIDTTRRAEGFGSSDEMEQQWYQETGGDYPFDEWLRTKKAQQYFATHSLPDPEWIGFNSLVDIEDLKLKYVQQQGKDIHDFDLWDSRARSLARKPYINEEALADMNASASLQDVLKVDIQSHNLGKILGATSEVRTRRVGAGLDNQYNIDIYDKRRDLTEKAYKRLGA